MGFFSRSRSVPDGDGDGSADQSTSLDATPKSKKEKKKAEKEQQLHSRIASDQVSLESTQSEERYLPLTLERPAWSSDSDQGFGYLSFERHVVLGLEQVTRLVDVVCEELSTRGGLDTPFIFSNLALDIKASAVKRLVKAFLGTCVVLVGREKDLAEKKWREEARFASMHELGMCLRWGLARIARVVDGVEVRGLLNWEHYLQWAEQEQALFYPPGHFREFLPTLATPLRLILLTTLSFLTRLTAHSPTSGHTPPSLSPLFGPLFFGLGPSGLPFNHTYTFYLRSVNAMEHILLAFIRWQNTPDATGSHSHTITGGTASALGVGVPPRLKEWIKGYPSMLDKSSNYRRFSAGSSPERRHRPRKGARTVRVVSVRRNVRTYERDLVKTAASWGERHPASAGSGTLTPSSGSSTVGFASSYEWLRISPPDLGTDSPRIPPRYSDAFKKRLNLSSSSPEMSFTHTLTPLIDSSSPPPSAFTMKTAFTFTSFTPESSSSNARGGGVDGDFKSLTDEKWNNFENIGFGGMGVDEVRDKKLQFDLTESARAARSIKRETMDWKTFSSSGFSRMDDPLQTALQLSVPPRLTLNTSSALSSPSSSPPATPVENRKLRKKVKNGAPTSPFVWDVEPVLGPEQIIEEAFVDVFCDLVRGSGWSEGLHLLPTDSKP
jgi:hypothetical protein